MFIYPVHGKTGLDTTELIDRLTNDRTDVQVSRSHDVTVLHSFPHVHYHVTTNCGLFLRLCTGAIVHGRPRTLYTMHSDTKTKFYTVVCLTTTVEYVVSLPLCLSLYPSVCPSIHLFYLSVCPPFPRPLSLDVSLCVYCLYFLSFFIYLSVRLSVRLSAVYLSVCLFYFTGFSYLYGSGTVTGFYGDRVQKNDIYIYIYIYKHRKHY